MGEQTYYERISAALPAEILTRDVPLSAYTTFHIGGPADVLIKPRNSRELRETVLACREGGVPMCVMGNGSNILVRDGGFRGAVVVLGTAMSSVKVAGNTIQAMAGARLSMVARAAAENRLAGMEFAYGIPGTVGGAVYMNAGAFHGQMQDIISRVTVMDHTGLTKSYSNDDMAFGYRTSRLHHTDEVIVEAELLLKRDNMAQIKARMEEYNAYRRDRQPLDIPSAGSTFKRPQDNYAAALIDQAGLKGLGVGGAQVSEKHAGFIVNTGNATAADVLALMDKVRDGVLRAAGVALEPEIRIIGED
ncbi:MAG: UDP-N-acetylmuramate dehydrogenase [Eubacteriales bacterium]|nr:UDP-N-acetylmuramate dehydrogenase [Eubacteriales bacterium]